MQQLRDSLLIKATYPHEIPRSYVNRNIINIQIKPCLKGPSTIALLSSQFRTYFCKTKFFLVLFSYMPIHVPILKSPRISLDRKLIMCREYNVMYGGSTATLQPGQPPRFLPLSTEILYRTHELPETANSRPTFRSNLSVQRNEMA